jgi:hypothetical protein
MDDLSVMKLFPPSQLAAEGGRGFFVHVDADERGKERAASAATLLAAPPEVVAREIEAVRYTGGFLTKIPMVHGVKLLEDRGLTGRLRLDFRYRFLLVGVKFYVAGDHATDGRSFWDTRGTEGSIRDLWLKLRLAPAGDGRSAFYCAVSFDIRSLGWLVDYFLKHHPEIEMGIFASSALVLARTLKEHIAGLAR